MTDYKAQAKQIVEKNIYCTIATASSGGIPWISPVFFAYDKNYNIYWVSNKNARHSRLIQDNSQVAIVIFNSQAPEGEGDGVYFESKAKALTDEREIEYAIAVLNKRIGKDAFRVNHMEDVTGKGVLRVYKAVPNKISKLTEGEYIDGQYVDKRVEVNLV